MATAVDDLVFSESIIISPNPNNGLFTIQSSSPLLNMASIEIENVLGEKIYSRIQQLANTTIDISSQPSGVYFMQIKSDHGITIRKIVKE